MRIHRVLLLALLLIPSFAVAEIEFDPLQPATSGGIETVDRALALLSSHRRLLVVGAHPDDEDNALLTYVSRALGGEAAYLSLSRGEGGQNLIGTELGVGLGVVRTGELLAARRVEGTRQYFTRVYDFGYTRSLEETFVRWPREVLQRDAVRVARRFKPQVVVAVFPASGRAGHGQHQASALIAADLFAMSGDARAFPELGSEGLVPWTPQRLYRRAWSSDEATVGYELGAIDPLTGRSYLQLAAASRSKHRSQDMGRVQPLGSWTSGLIDLVTDVKEEGTEIFGGVDTRLQAIAETMAEGREREQIESHLRRVAELAVATRSELSPTGLYRAVTPLAGIVGELVAALEAAERADVAVVRDLLAEKLAVAQQGLAAAAGVVADATADREEVTAGGQLEVTASLWAPGKNPAAARVTVRAAEGWQAEKVEEDSKTDDRGVDRTRFDVQLAVNVEPTQPYYLHRPLIGDLYDWGDTPATALGEPSAPPPLAAVFDLHIAGAPVRLIREVVYRYGDQAVGEVRRPLRALPQLEIVVGSDLELLADGRAAEVVVDTVLRSHASEPQYGVLLMETPEGWPVPEPVAFSIEPGREETVSLPVTPGESVAAGRYPLRISGQLTDGSSASDAFQVIDYPHIRPAVLPRRSELKVSTFDLRLPDLERVGYVRGASDRVPEVLEALGVPVEILDRDVLRRGELSGFDVIIIGSRAYEIDAVLREANDRLLEYVRAGGLLIVQYQQYQFVRGNYALLPLEIHRPHGRVTDETAPVEMLVPEHVVFRQPNPISAADWEGWVQERGLYFASMWDDGYRPLLRLADSGREPESGALLVAEVGEGTYVYTGLSFFRQLPAGVPGAIRLFVNLLGL